MSQAKEKPLADLARDVIENVQEMVRSEVRLAKAEIREETARAAAAGRIAGAGALLGLYALGFLLVAAMRGLQYSMADWMAALTVGVVTAIGGVIFWSIGRRKFQTVKTMPEKTIESIKENLQWNKSPNG